MSVSEITKILAQAKRSPEQVEQLKDYFIETNRFLREEITKLNGDHDTLRALFQSLGLEEIKGGKTLFTFGESGSTFYILLEGEVEIRVPSPVQISGATNSPEGVLVFLINYFEIVYWEKIHNGKKVKKELIQGLSALGLNIFTMDKSDLLA